MADNNFVNHFDRPNVGAGERRRSGRYNFTASADVIEPRSHLRITARTSDFDHRGCYIDTFNPFPEGTNVVLRVAKENLAFNTMATVVHSQAGIGMGVIFDALAAEQQRILEQWIGRANSQAPSMPQAPQKPAAKETTQSATVRNLVEQQPGEVLKYLVLMLMQKGVLVEFEGQALLEKLLN